MSTSMTSSNITNITTNLDEIEQEIETSSAFFKPKPGKTYIVKMDPANVKVVGRDDERFKDAQGRPNKIVLKITRTGADRTTTYQIDGVE